MYFHPPTLEPGTAATWIALALLAYHVAAPPLLRSVNARRLRPGSGEARAPYAARLRTGGWFVLAEALVVMAFVGTATAVTGADLGWAAPRLADSDLLVTALVAAGSLYFLVFFLVSLARANRGLVAQVRSGELPTGVDRNALLVLPQDRREYLCMVGVGVLGVLSHVLVVYTVLYPMLALAFGSPLLAVAVLGLLGGWQSLGQGGGLVLAMTVLTSIGLVAYAVLVPGSLLVPLLVWACYLGVALGTTRGFVGVPVPESSPAPYPVGVTLLDADGRPLERD